MDTNQFEEYYQKYFDDIFRYVLTIVKNEEDVKDILQETFIKLYQHQAPFESQQHVKSWLLKVASNSSKNLFRHWYRNRRIEVEDFNSFQSAQESERQYLQEVFDLPLHYRQAIFLFYYEDLTIQSISELLNKPESTIKTHLSRGRELLKGVLKDERI